MQIMYVIIGVVFMFKLIFMNKNTGSHLVNDPKQLLAWQEYKRREYFWMIAGGWGAAGIVFLGFIADNFNIFSGQLTQGNEVVAPLAGLVMSVLVIIICYLASSRQAKQAKSLEKGIL